MKKGKIFLVGAGCGRYDLITLRGKQLLEECDAVVYDSLIDRRLLDFAPENAQRIPVGKRCGKPSEKQENINAIIVEKALEGKNVVRLKGGDPFVFGRGGEEIQAAAENGIEYEAVPGITSCIAAAELAGIPVTHRRVSRGFHVITGHTADDLLPENMGALAKEKDTLVFLMGLNRLSEITSALITGGKPANTPAAVVSNGGTAAQRAVRGTLGDIAEITEQAQLPAPAVIIIGDAAQFDFTKTVKHPLDDVTVTAVGTESFTRRLDEQLTRLGADVYRLPIVKTAENAAQLDFALAQIPSHDTIVFTSAKGVKAFFGALSQSRTDIRTLCGKHFAVIGAGTADALQKFGIYADIIPPKYSAEALAEELSARNNAGSLLILRAEKGSRRLSEILDSNGVKYTDVKIYDTVSVRAEGCTVDSEFLIFGSASGAESFIENGFSVSASTKIIVIGQSTAQALNRLGVPNFVTAEQSDIGGIVQKIAQIKGAKL